MYEHRSEPILPGIAFLYRMVRHGVAALALVMVSLGIGILGYHVTERLSWIDSLLNASMILGGMGPVNPLETVGGKLFASAYALFSGIVFIGTATILVAPLAHRLIHRLHLEESKDDAS